MRPCPEPGEVPAGEEALWSAIYEHRLGSAAPARRVFGDDRARTYWCSVEVSECGRFAVLVQVGLRARQRRLPAAPRRRRVRAGGARDAVGQPRAGDRRLAAHPDRPRRAARPALRRVAGGTDGVADAHPRRTRTRCRRSTGVGGRLYAVYSHAASHRVRIHAEDGAYLRDLELPALGSVDHNEAAASCSGVSGAGAATRSGWTSRRTCSRRPSTATTTRPTG